MTPAQQVRFAVARLQSAGVAVRYVKGWDDLRIAGRGTFAPRFTMLHHTAGTSSLAYMTRPNGEWGPVRLAHFLVNRDGSVDVCAAVKTYHAGRGGPKWGVAAGGMNGYAWGIEIEDLGRGLTMTDAQIASAAMLAGGLNDAMGRRDVDATIQHREWNPSGKTDTRYPTTFWLDRIAEERKKVSTTVVASKVGPTLKHSGKVGSSSPMYKTPLAKPVTVTGGQEYTAAVLDLPAGRYICTFQVRMPKGVGAAEAELVRLGWPGLTKEDSTGHNPVPAASRMFGVWRRWRTPIEHSMDGGGKVAFRIVLPAGSHPMRFVCKATRIA